MLDHMGVPFIKVGSGDNCNLPLLRRAAATGRPLLVSTGMMNLRDLRLLHGHLTRMNAKFALLHCVSSYPAPHEQLNLRFIAEMKRLFPETHVGYSGHEMGTDVCIAAVAVGARVSTASTASRADAWISEISRDVSCYPLLSRTLSAQLPVPGHADGCRRV